MSGKAGNEGPEFPILAGFRIASPCPTKETPAEAAVSGLLHAVLPYLY